ncbi:MAG: ATP-binding protein [Bacteroidales bacterium]|nr:ATP-binding protein [Bacteroidales bacterium]
MENPFKFGTIVEEEYFTDRVEEVAYICQFVKSANHLVLISPRRFGKSSVVAKAVKQTGRKHITVNLQQVTSVADLSAKLLKEFFKVHPLERVRHLITHFRIIPTVSANPVTGAMDVSFQPGVDGAVLLEDVLTLIERAHSEKDRIIVVLDEFQDILEIAPRLDRQLRSIMQEQKHINYILLGSQESMMTDIFENKKSPFYHFGELMRLSKLPREDFHRYLSERLVGCFKGCEDALADRILDYTGCHPYYSQQLAANVWQVGVLQPETEDPIAAAIDHIVKAHGLDYERLWMNFKRTNKWILQHLASNRPLQSREYPTSTVYSALKRLQKDGYVIYSDHYELEDPFFRQWIVEAMQ